MVAFGAAIVVSAVAVGSATAAGSTGPSTTVVDCGQATTLTQVFPAPGVDPLTATDQELSTNGYPPRPTNADEYAVWKAYVSGPITRLTQCAEIGGRGTTGNVPLPVTP